MALEYNELLSLGKTLAKADKTAPTAFAYGDKKFSYTELDDTFRSELKELIGTPALYRENKNKWFSLIEDIVEDVLPKKVMDQYGAFAEIKTFAQGDKPIFKQKITAASRKRARSFIGKVGLAGVYEVFRLDGAAYEVPTNAIGGAARYEFEEYLDGRTDFADILETVLEGLDDCIYIEIAKQLFGAVGNFEDTANKVTYAGFDETLMDNLLQISDSYINGKSDIYCTFEFAAAMVPSEGWVSDDHRNEKWSKGYIANYKGHKVIILPQSFTDETNTTKVIDPQYAWIIPSGANKPVKVAFEGGTCTREVENHDWSKEIQIYKKVGVCAILSTDMCVYQNTALAD